MINYNDQKGVDYCSDLCFDSIYGLTIKCFDSQVLLNPFEEQFDQSAVFIIVGDSSGSTISDNDQKDHILSAVRIDQTTM